MLNKFQHKKTKQKKLDVTTQTHPEKLIHWLMPMARLSKRRGFECSNFLLASAPGDRPIIHRTKYHRGPFLTYVPTDQFDRVHKSQSIHPGLVPFPPPSVRPQSASPSTYSYPFCSGFCTSTVSYVIMQCICMARCLFACTFHLKNAFKCFKSFKI